MVDSISTIALETPWDLLINEVIFISSMSDHVEEVYRQLDTMHSFLKDVDERGYKYNLREISKP